jgi:hypothetical protein
MPTKSAFSGATRQGHRLWCAGASLAIVKQCREGSGQLGDVRAPANAGRNLILEIGLHWPGLITRKSQQRPRRPAETAKGEGQAEMIKCRDKGGEALAEIGRSNVRGWTISRRGG